MNPYAPPVPIDETPYWIPDKDIARLCDAIDFVGAALFCVLFFPLILVAYVVCFVGGAWE